MQTKENPWLMSTEGMDKRSSEYKNIMIARAEAPELNPEYQKEKESTPKQLPVEPVKPIEVIGKVVKSGFEFPFPDKIILKPINNQKFRLGLEQQKEGFLRVPGTSYTWEPSIVGDRHKTGLHRLTDREIKLLESQIGKNLDSEFYVELGMRLDGSNPNGQHIDLSKPLNKVIYLAMLESHLIAGTISERRNGIKPEAEWYIENQEAEAEVLQKEQDKFTQVFNAYQNISNAKKVSFAKILNVQVRGISEKAASVKLWEALLDKKQPKYNDFLTRFLQIATWSDEKVNVYSETKDAIAANIIRRNGAQDYIYGEEVLGSTEEQVINKLLMGENGGLRAAIKARLYVR